MTTHTDNIERKESSDLPPKPVLYFRSAKYLLVDGYEAIRRLRATPTGRAIPIIAVTASAFEDNEKQVMGTGADAYLRKPFRREEIFGEMGKLLKLPYVLDENSADRPLRSSPVPTVPMSLVGLPAELLGLMRQAVSDGGIALLAGLIDQVEKLDSATANCLRELAARFDYEKLAELLSKGD